MIARNFFVLCILCGVFAVVLSKLVNYNQRQENISRFDEAFRRQ